MGCDYRSGGRLLDTPLPQEGGSQGPDQNGKTGEGKINNINDSDNLKLLQDKLTHNVLVIIPPILIKRPGQVNASKYFLNQTVFFHFVDKGRVGNAEPS